MGPKTPYFPQKAGETTMQVFLNPESIQSIFGPEGGQTEGIVERFSPRAGSSFHATVIFVSDKTANLKLDSGAIIRASVQGLSAIAEGDRVQFLVNENSGHRIMLSPLEIMRPGVGKIFDASLSGSSPAGGFDPSILQALARSGVSMTAELEGRIAELVAAYPRLEADLAVFLAANRLPPTAESLALSELLQTPDAKTDVLISNVLKTMTEALRGQEGAPKPAAGGDDPSRSGTGAQISSDKAAAPQAEHVYAEAVKGATAEADVIISGAPVLTKSTDTPEAREGERPELPSSAPLPASAPGEEGQNTAVSGQAGRTAGTDAAPLQAFTALLTRAFPALATPEDAGPGGLQPFDPTALQNLEASLFIELQGASGGKIKEGLAQLPAKIALLSSFAANLPAAGKEPASAGLNQLSSLLRFTQSLSFPGYVQLPYQRQGQRETAELFAFRRRKKTISAPGSDLIVVVGLDTVHLGRLEGKIKLSTQGVSLELLCEREETTAFAREHTAALSQALSRAGVRILSVKVGTLVQRTNSMNAPALLKEEEPEANLRINLVV